MENNWSEYRDKIIGLGENSFKKSYYPELQSKIEDLENSRANLITIFNSTSDAIIIYDINGRIISMNKQALILYNINPEEVSNYSIFDLSSEKNDNSRLLQQWTDIPQNGNVTIEWIANQINTQKEIYVYVSINKTFWDKKEVLVAVVRDFTERKEYEQNLLKALTKAEESDRLKTAFLQNMSHEIRTPLNAISGFSELLDIPDLSDDKRATFVQIIQNSSNQLISIISDILTISSLETNQVKINTSSVCINSTIIELLTIFKEQARKQNILLYAKQQLNDSESEIFTDKTKIIQILSNLISNALKFTHEGFVEFGYNLKESYLEFYVKDSGIGINPEFHETIFERFRQADKSINKLYGGTGLGLAISKAFVELLGGKIRVQSELGSGSTFYFSILYRPANKIINISSSIENCTECKTILVAEDEEYNFLYLEELLNRINIKIIHTKDGTETINSFKQNPQVALILMDIKMPNMSGDEAAKIIKKFKPDLPIIAQSAYALEDDIKKHSGIFNDYLTKPIKKDDLLNMLSKYIPLYQQ
jgi:PAS domain S-box-containing protein